MNLIKSVKSFLVRGKQEFDLARIAYSDSWREMQQGYSHAREEISEGYRLARDEMREGYRLALQNISPNEITLSESEYDELHNRIQFLEEENARLRKELNK